MEKKIEQKTIIGVKGISIKDLGMTKKEAEAYVKEQNEKLIKKENQK